MAVSRGRLPHLNHLMDTYLHEDWRLFGDTFDAVVAAYGNDSSPEEITALASEIEQLLSVRTDDLEAEYQRLYPNSVQPSALGMTAESWLRSIVHSTERVEHA